LKKIIGNFATQFSGFGQQDSQEFISYLIDGLSEDLNLVKKKETFDAGDEIKPDEEMSRESELNYAKRINSYVRSLMAGQFKSTVVCSACQKISVCFDPYLLISMPVPPTECFLFFVPAELSKCAIRLPVPVSYSTTTLDKVSSVLAIRYNKYVDREKRS
jgi:ubiquitin C-terminal hydrolase